LAPLVLVAAVCMLIMLGLLDTARYFSSRVMPRKMFLIVSATIISYIQLYNSL
jgi:hypothetical protein